MNLLLNKAHYPVTVLGPGRRVGLWTQGCWIRCEGCLSLDTWPAIEDRAVSIDAVMEWVGTLPADEIDGVTISGGEPFDQPEALLALLEALAEWRAGIDRPIDVLCYSGRDSESVQRDFAPQLALLDAVVTEPFVKDLASDTALRGSSNQRVIPLTPLGRSRYGEEQLAALSIQRHQLQYDVAGEAMWFIGIPREGDLARLRAAAASDGVAMRRPSWQA
jgi:anaerobic ribonucleoside-triphosphate reductase activating protein